LDNKRILWVGDAVASTGFAKNTHHICDAFHAAGYEVHILGVNYYGDPHSHPYNIYPASPGGSFLGFNRIKGMVQTIQPAIVFLQTDPWHVPNYIDAMGEHSMPVVGVIAIDGLNPKGALLNSLDHVIFWTKFAQEQAENTGYVGPSSVIQLGVDRDIYKPMRREDARKAFHFDEMLAKRGYAPDTFIVGCVGRNQWRKRLDLTIQYFAEFVHRVNNAVLWMHVNPCANDAWELQDLARYFGVQKQVLIPQLKATGLAGVPEKQLAVLYSCLDVLLTTTMGEGFGLPIFEAMACQVPVIAPRWSALGELATKGAILVDCPTIAVHPEQTNTIGGVPDMEHTVNALATLYDSERVRGTCGLQALALVSEPQFDWHTIGSQYLEFTSSVLETHAVQVA
jgi:D-inositol-3-phosphate glycosyltransferase